MTMTLPRFVARLLLAPAWMIALAVMVKGYASAGDGFSAGVIAALGILIQYLVFGPGEAGDLLPVRYATRITLVGLLIALTVTFAPVLAGWAAMTHFPRPGEDVVHLGSLEILTAVVFDVGVFLIVFGFAVGAIDLIARTTARSRR